MDDGASFDSWRPAWHRYGQIVSTVAAHLSNGLSTTDLRTHIISNVAEVFVDTTHFDPLEALLAPFLHRCSTSERAGVAQYLVARGVQRERAESITETNARSASTTAHSDEWPAVSADRIPTFDEIKQVAIHNARETRLEAVRAKFEARMTERMATASGRVGMSSRQDLRSPSRTRGRRRMLLGLGAMVVAALGLTATAVAVGTRKGNHGSSGTASYLVVNALPGSWDIVGAATLPRTPARVGATVQQVFDGPTPSGRLVVSTQSFSPVFTDQALGPVTVPLSALMHQPQSTARAFIRDWTPIEIGTPRDPNQVLDLNWTEHGLYVTVEGKGLTASEMENFARGLVPIAEDPLQGWRSPDDRYRQKDRTRNAGEVIGSRSAVAFRSRRIPMLTVVASMDEVRTPKPTDGPATTSDSQDPPTSLVRLPSNKLVTRNPTTQTYSWSDHHHQFRVAYAMGVDGGRSVETNFSQGLPNLIPQAGPGSGEAVADRRDVEELVDLLRVGSRKQWAEQLRSYQDRLLAVPVANHLTAGTYTVNLRVSTDPAVPQTACTHLLCSPVYRHNDRRCADLEIEGHWWHFEEVPASEPIPSWRTSPSSATESHPYYRQYGWYGVDLGPNAQAARRNNENELLTRASYG